MSVNLVKTPIPAPLHNPTDGACIEFGLNMPIADLVIIAPDKCILIFEIPPSPVALGGFNFHGHTFTPGGSGFTASTWQVVAGNQNQTAINMANMLKSNIDIYPNFNITVAWSGNPLDPAYMNAEALLWGYVEPGVFSNSTGWPVTFQAGSQGFYRETKKIAYQLFYVGFFDEETALIPLQVFKPRLNLTNYSTYDIDIDFAKVLKGLPSTMLPYLDANVIQWDQNIIKKFYLKYGSIDNASCNTYLTQFAFSDNYWLINQAIDLRNEGGPKDFSYQSSPQNLAIPMNHGPIAGVGYYRDSYNWLWFNFNFRLLGGAYANWFGAAQIKLYNSSGAVISTYTEVWDPSGPGNYNGVGVGILPIGGANFFAPGGLPSDCCYVKIKWLFQDSIEDPSEQEQLSEEITIRYKDGGCEPYEFYFLCEYGGYDTIRFEKFEEVVTKISQQTLSYQEYCRDFNSIDPVSDYYTYLVKSGSNQGNTIANRRFRVTSGKMSKSDKVNRLVEMFLKSESRFFKLTSSGPTKVGAVKINIVSSDTIVYKETGKVVYIFEFQFAENLATISEK